MKLTGSPTSRVIDEHEDADAEDHEGPLGQPSGQIPPHSTSFRSCESIRRDSATRRRSFPRRAVWRRHRGPTEVLREAVDVLVVDEPHEVRLVVADLQGIFVVVRRTSGRARTGRRRSGRPSPRCCSSADAARLVIRGQLAVGIEEVVGARHVDRVGPVLTVEEHVEVGAELEDLELDIEANRRPVAGDRFEQLAVIGASARLADQLDRRSADAGLLEQSLGLLGRTGMARGPRCSRESTATAAVRRRSWRTRRRVGGDGLLVDGEVEGPADVGVGGDPLVGVEDQDRVLLARTVREAGRLLDVRGARLVIRSLRSDFSPARRVARRQRTRGDPEIVPPSPSTPRWRRSDVDTLVAVLEADGPVPIGSSDMSGSPRRWPGSA